MGRVVAEVPTCMHVWHDRDDLIVYVVALGYDLTLVSPARCLAQCCLVLGGGLKASKVFLSLV